jgi:hypothetical protein
MFHSIRFSPNVSLFQPKCLVLSTTIHARASLKLYTGAPLSLSAYVLSTLGHIKNINDGQNNGGIFSTLANSGGWRMITQVPLGPKPYNDPLTTSILRCQPDRTTLWESQLILVAEDASARTKYDRNLTNLRSPQSRNRALCIRPKHSKLQLNTNEKVIREVHTVPGGNYRSTNGMAEDPRQQSTRNPRPSGKISPAGRR